MVERVVVKLPCMGSPKIEAQGFTGTACTDATARMEAALAGSGDKVTILKDEYHEVAAEQTVTTGQSW